MVGLLNLSQFMENARHPLLQSPVPKGRAKMEKGEEKEPKTKIRVLQKDIYRYVNVRNKEAFLFLLVGQTSISN